jgi:16S rRNA (guanine527-N7)-methyltransferase
MPDNWTSTAALLQAGLVDLGLNAQTGAPLLQFLRLLQKWNAAYNLTAVEEPEQMVTHHLFDALATRPFLRGPRIVDVGTGAGIPGIPLAIVCPEFEFVLLDSNSKKTRFIKQAIIELRLHNAIAVHNRAEQYRPEKSFDTVLSRAFTSLAQMLQMTQHLCAPDGIFVAMKGRYPRDELRGVQAPFAVERVAPVQVPHLEAERHVVLLKHLSPPPAGEG